GARLETDGLSLPGPPGVGSLFFFCQAEGGIRDRNVTGVQTCALPISHPRICGQPLTKKLKEGLKDFKSEARKSRQTKISGPALSAVTRDFLWRRMWDLNPRGA